MKNERFFYYEGGDHSKERRIWFDDIEYIASTYHNDDREFEDMDDDSIDRYCDEYLRGLSS
jgi:hypothetical protein